MGCGSSQSVKVVRVSAADSDSTITHKPAPVQPKPVQQSEPPRETPQDTNKPQTQKPETPKQAAPIAEPVAKHEDTKDKEVTNSQQEEVSKTTPQVEEPKGTNDSHGSKVEPSQVDQPKTQPDIERPTEQKIHSEKEEDEKEKEDEEEGYMPYSERPMTARSHVVRPPSPKKGPVTQPSADADPEEIWLKVRSKNMFHF